MNEPTDLHGRSPAYYALLLADLQSHPHDEVLSGIQVVEEALLTYDFAPTPENHAALAQCWQTIAALYRQLDMPDDAYEASYLAASHAREAGTQPEGES